MRFNRTTLAAVTAVALVGIGTGSALAANGAVKAVKTTPAEQQTAVIAALAGKLNITSDTLKAALVATAKDRVAAELAAGTITQAQADAANARIDAGQGLLGPIGGRGGGFGHHGGGVDLSTAATYLGMTAADLRTALDGGKTLATIATEKGKTAAGLEAALVAAEKTELDARTGLTAAQKAQLLADVTARIKDMVENGAPAGGPGMGMGGGRHSGFGRGGDGFGPGGGFGPGTGA